MIRQLTTELEIQLINQLIQNTSNLVLFDIGACDFSTSIGLKNAFPNSTVYGFEPDVDNLEQHAKVAKLNSINVVDIALSNTNGIIRFYPSDSYNNHPHRASGSTRKPRVHENTSEGLYHKTLFFNTTGYNVNVSTLSDFCKINNISEVDFIHMDVQGAEFDVIRGMGEYRPRIIAAETCEFGTYETEGTVEDFDALMLELGYIVFERCVDDTIYILNK